MNVLSFFCPVTQAPLMLIAATFEQATENRRAKLKNVDSKIQNKNGKQFTLSAEYFLNCP